MGDIYEIGAHTRMTVRDVLELSLRQADEFQCVMVIGFSRDGELMCRSSAMDRSQANWILDSAKQWVLFGKTTLAIGPRVENESP